MSHQEDIRDHKKQIDARIKEGIDRLLRTGDVLEEDFFYNEKSEKMLKINDEEGKEIIFNYTRAVLYSYGGRLNEDYEL